MINPCNLEKESKNKFPPKKATDNSNITEPESVFIKNKTNHQDKNTIPLPNKPNNERDKNLKQKYLNTKNDQVLTIHHLNCRSSVNKEEEILNYTEEHDPDLICLTETWMDESVVLTSHIPPGYKIIRNDRSEKFKEKYGKNGGGGIAILYKKHLIVEKINLIKEETEEILWLNVKVKKGLILGILYNTGYCDLLSEKNGESILENHLKEATSKNCDICILGDFNIDLKKPSMAKTRKLKRIFKDYKMKQIITPATRIDKNTGRESLIDHIWLNTENINNGVLPGISDHFSTYVHLRKEKIKIPPRKIKIRNFKNFNIEKFSNNLESNLKNSKLKNFLESENLNEGLKELTEKIQNTLDSHAPIIEIYENEKKQYIPWYTAELKEKLNKKREMLQDARSHGMFLYKKEIKYLTNKINAIKRALKTEFATKELENSEKDIKELWKILNLLLGNKRKETIMPEFLTQEKINEFNHFFATIGYETQKTLKIEFKDDKDKKTYHFEPFQFQKESKESIEKIINLIKSNVATGYDNIPSKIIKMTKEILSPLFADLINLSYKTGTFPDSLKIAVVTPIFKENDKNEIKNYRPISILPVISKIFEKSATKQLSEYLEKNTLLSPLQHAYRKYHSTVTCLFELLNNIYEKLDNKKMVAIVSLDLSKAFDSINHQLLLQKLENLNLDKNSIKYIKSYLENRTQMTKFPNFISKGEKIKSGVPQGSILGPLLFLCFVNDLPETFDKNCEFLSYADDTQLIVTAENAQSLKNKIENVIDTAQKWYTKNGLKNNSDKSKVLLIGNRKKNIPKFLIKITINDKDEFIKPKKSLKILGIHIDEQLNWAKQIRVTKRNAINVIRQVSRINKYIPQKYRLMLYQTLISPKFDYADIIWGGCSVKNEKYLQSAQNYAVKSILGKRKYDSGSEALKELKLINLKKRRMVHEAVFAHKSLTGKTTKTIYNRYNHYKSKFNTRNSCKNKLNIPQHNSTKYKKSPLYRTIKSWNKSLPVLDLGNIKNHKETFQKSLLDNSSINPQIKCN